MISSVFFTLRGLSLYLSLLLFISSILLTQFSYSRDQQLWSNYGIMPVITQSKARKLCSLINEGHDIQFTSNILINETYCSIHEHNPSDNASPASIHELPSTVLLSDNPSFSYNSVMYTEPSSMASSVVTSSLEATPSNFSNFHLNLVETPRSFEPGTCQLWLNFLSLAGRIYMMVQPMIL